MECDALSDHLCSQFYIDEYLHICIGIQKVEKLVWNRKKVQKTVIEKRIFRECGSTLCLRPHKKRTVNVACWPKPNVTSWLKWLQIRWNDSKWVSMCLKTKKT